MKFHLPDPNKFLESVKNNFFLRKHQPQESTMQILRDLYPTVNWNRVDFYEGLPWFTSSVAPYVTAQALPQFYSFSRYRIYLKKFDESRAQCLSDIVHEAFHVMQAMHFGKGYGIGFFRGWMFYYIALFGKYGYRQNPFEIPAYDQEFRFLGYCEKNRQHGISPPVRKEAFVNIRYESALVFRDIVFRYSESFLLLLGSFFFCSFITLVKPIADVLAFVTSKILNLARKTQTG